MRRQLQSPQGKLNIAAWEPRSIANGPGERFVLWVQGCPHQCRGCFNQDFRSFVDKNWMEVEEVAALIRRVQGIEGVTLSGGEPMSQAEALYSLTEELRSDHLSVVCYTGYTLSQLETNPAPWIQRLLGNTDILIDGLYEEGRRTTAKWRGSLNQKIHFLSPTYEHLGSLSDSSESDVEFIVGTSGFITTGNPMESMLRRIEELLARR